MSLLACLIRCQYSIALPISLSKIVSSYPGEVVCTVISILPAASKRLRRLVSDSISTWFFGAACVDNSAASYLAL